MDIKCIYLTCPTYKFDENIDLKNISLIIDNSLIDNFYDKNVVLRGVQSEKHNISKQEIINHILATGSDKYETTSSKEVNVSDEQIDLFGYGCKINKSPITLSIIEGFHKWKPKSLEKPQLKVDIWMIYDANQLNNIEYNHSYYGVKASDGYTFKNPDDKQTALIGVIVIN